MSVPFTHSLHLNPAMPMLNEEMADRLGEAVIHRFDEALFGRARRRKRRFRPEGGGDLTFVLASELDEARGLHHFHGLAHIKSARRGKWLVQRGRIWFAETCSEFRHKFKDQFSLRATSLNPPQAKINSIKPDEIAGVVTYSLKDWRAYKKEERINLL